MPFGLTLHFMDAHNTLACMHIDRSEAERLKKELSDAKMLQVQQAEDILSVGFT